MRQDLRVAVQLVSEGHTFSTAAEATGLTRNAVAGACHRAGVKSGSTFALRAKRIGDGMRRFWATKSSAYRRRHMQAMRAAQMRAS